MALGVKKVVILAGINKLTADSESALCRVKEIAAPKNAKSLGKAMPCAEIRRCLIRGLPPTSPSLLY